MQVYKLLSMLEKIPPEGGYEFSILAWSVFTLIVEDEGTEDWVKFADDSAIIEIAFPVWLFHTCMVPSQEATLPLKGRIQMSFTTWKQKNQSDTQHHSVPVKQLTNHIDII